MNKSEPIRYPLLEELLSFCGLTLQATYTNRDVAKLFGVSVRSIQNRITAGQLIPAIYRVEPNFCRLISRPSLWAVGKVAVDMAAISASPLFVPLCPLPTSLRISPPLSKGGVDFSETWRPGYGLGHPYFAFESIVLKSDELRSRAFLVAVLGFRQLSVFFMRSNLRQLVRSAETFAALSDTSPLYAISSCSLSTTVAFRMAAAVRSS